MCSLSRHPTQTKPSLEVFRNWFFFMPIQPMPLYQSSLETECKIKSVLWSQALIWSLHANLVFQALDTQKQHGIAQPKRDTCLSSPSHFSSFNRCFSVVCSLIKGISPKICMLCFVLMNSVILNLLCVWILSLYFDLRSLADGRS